MKEEGSLEINVGEIKKGIGNTVNFLRQKKNIWIIIGILLLLLIILTSLMRVQNIPLLKDSTTGEYIPLALDPYYFLRVAETAISPEGLPAYDNMRYPSAMIPFSHGVTSDSVILMYRIADIFTDADIRFIDIISPVVFFGLGILVFFFLILALTKSKWTALLGSIFLSIIPSYIYRTMAGFSDHEAIGMFAFFLAMLCYSLALKYLGKTEKKGNYTFKSILFGLLVGFISAFTIASWGGISKFIFMIIPISFGLFWLVKVQNLEDIRKKTLLSFLLFYVVWFFSSIIFGFIFGFNLQAIIGKVFLSSSSLINGVVLLFLIIDFSMLKLKDKIPLLRKESMTKYRIIYSVIIALIIGLIFASIYYKNLFSLIADILNRFLHPFGSSRTGLTVAENRQPFLNNWINQTGKIFFWLFFGGLLILGKKISETIRMKKNKITFFLLWVLMILGILFSRISASSVLNGTNFISKLFYFGSLIIFFIFIMIIYFKDKIKTPPETLILFAWAFLMLISARGAIRFFFLMTPFVCLSAGFFAVEITKYAKKSKDDFIKLILFILVILTIVGVIISLNNFVGSSMNQTKYTSPSADEQWQKAMSWVRTNTQEGSIFVHWWDYGYWVQYLGERPTVTDGGHGVSYWDHLIGRYLLTTTRPETALSFMKSHDVSYLLIDPTDIGKYSAYSSIGGNKNGEDRYSWIFTMVSDPAYIQETKQGITRLYNGGSILDEDIIYNNNGKEIFLPANKAAIGGTILEIKQEENSISFSQPQGIYIYNNNQMNLPIRYLYFNGELVDFKKGIEATVYVIPKLTSTKSGVNSDEFGAIIYLSPRNMKSLVAQLYILNDPFNQYGTLKLVHSEPAQIVSILNSQGHTFNELVLFNGIKGPIKIWEVDYPSNIIEREEFRRTKGEYAEFDQLEFVR